jgi:hypothetical protein
VVGWWEVVDDWLVIGWLVIGWRLFGDCLVVVVGGGGTDGSCCLFFFSFLWHRFQLTVSILFMLNIQPKLMCQLLLCWIVPITFVVHDMWTIEHDHPAHVGK